MEKHEPESRRRRVARAAAALLALAACALAISPEPPPDRLLEAAFGRLAARGPLLRSLLDSGFAIMAGAGLAALLVLAVDALIQKLRAGRTGSAGRRNFLRRSLLNAVIGYALLLLFVAVFRRGPEGGRAAGKSSSEAEAARAAGVSGAPAGGTADLSAEDERRVPVFPLMAAGAVAAAGLGAYLIAAREARRRALALGAGPFPPEEEDEAPPGPEALAAARRALESDPSARAAIVRCYGAMCDLFAREARFGPEAASPRLTARELAAFLRSKGAGAPEIAALTAVFEKARYSNEDCVEADRRGAAAALAAIELAYGPGTPAAGGSA